MRGRDGQTKRLALGWNGGIWELFQRRSPNDAVPTPWSLLEKITQSHRLVPLINSGSPSLENHCLPVPTSSYFKQLLLFSNSFPHHLLAHLKQNPQPSSEKTEVTSENSTNFLPSTDALSCVLTPLSSSRCIHIIRPRLTFPLYRKLCALGAQLCLSCSPL